MGTYTHTHISVRCLNLCTYKYMLNYCKWFRKILLHHENNGYRSWYSVCLIWINTILTHWCIINLCTSPSTTFKESYVNTTSSLKSRVCATYVSGDASPRQLLYWKTHEGLRAVDFYWWDIQVPVFYSTLFFNLSYHHSTLGTKCFLKWRISCFFLFA